MPMISRIIPQANMPSFTIPDDVPPDQYGVREPTPRRARIWKTHESTFQKAIEILSGHYVHVLPERERVLVKTTNLYPYGETVFVSLTVSQGDNTAIKVTDEGQGLSRIISHVVDTSKPGAYLGKYADRWGVTYRGGEVFSICKYDHFENLPNIINRVASASSDGVARHIEEHNFVADKPTIISRLSDFVVKRFRTEFRPRTIKGRMETHRLDYVNSPHSPPDHSKYEIVGDRAIIIDPVLPARASLEARASRRADLAGKHWSNLQYFGIYDRQDGEWDGWLDVGAEMGLNLIPLPKLAETVAPLLSH